MKPDEILEAYSMWNSSIHSRFLKYWLRFAVECLRDKNFDLGGRDIHGYVDDGAASLSK